MQKKQNIVTIVPETRQAKYRQIINSIIEAIANGRLKRGDKVPSINDIAKEYGLSRDTVMLAFNELKARGIIASVAGIGYFVESTNVALDHKIFLLFDELNSFKENLYNSFLESLSGKASVDIFFHHFNKRVFEGLIRDNLNRYTSFAILPGNLTHIASILEALPDDKVYILDQFPDELKGKYPGVYQAFDEEIYHSMSEGLPHLRKYRNFVLVFPGGKEPEGFQIGFERFCNDFSLPHETIPNLKGRIIRNGEVYILLNDSDLVTVIKSSAALGLEIGREVGIISINDTPLKEVVQGGITTITTDFTEMGRTLARMILNQEKGEIKNPSQLIVRNSL